MRRSCREAGSGVAVWSSGAESGRSGPGCWSGVVVFVHDAPPFVDLLGQAARAVEDVDAGVGSNDLVGLLQVLQDGIEVPVQDAGRDPRVLEGLVDGVDPAQCVELLGHEGLDGVVGSEVELVERGGERQVAGVGIEVFGIGLSGGSPVPVRPFGFVMVGASSSGVNASGVTIWNSRVGRCSWAARWRCSCSRRCIVGTIQTTSGNAP